ncbi:hypothetical protein KEM55_002306 [Ascosphaera atra]|nr:hypothetical protein KEM55_002306 [Ascosphaera atra]
MPGRFHDDDPTPRPHRTVLDDKSFGEVVGGEKDVLVAFTAPWCGHCKRLTPTYDSLASTFAREPTVVIAKVDCEHPSSQRVAADQNIQGFPTIKFFPRGSSDAIDYSGARSEEAFVRFLNEHAGTHRQAGGSLDEQGGVVEALDHVLEKYTGENIEDIIDDLKEAAGAAPGKYGAYYVKVAEKVRANKEYVKKESERLGKILGKGGLAGEKLDDLVSRSNILRRFVPKQIIGEDDDAEVEEEVVKGEQIRDEL